MFKKDKCRVLHSGRNDHMNQYSSGANLLEMNPTENDLGVSVDNRLKTIERCALVAKASSILGCIKNRVAAGRGK